MAFQDEDTALSLEELLSTPRGRLTVLCDLLCLLGMLPFVFIEAATVSAYGVKGWATTWNLLDAATYINQARCSSHRIARSLSFCVRFCGLGCQEHLDYWDLKSITLNHPIHP